MPDLGKYADTVLAAYCLSILCLLALVGLSLWQGRKMKQALARAEVAARVGSES